MGTRHQLYWILSLLLMYLIFVQLTLVKTMHTVLPQYVQWFRVVTLGVWETVFADAETPMTDW
jgi:hypothetical protein